MTLSKTSAIIKRKLIQLKVWLIKCLSSCYILLWYNFFVFHDFLRESHQFKILNISFSFVQLLIFNFQVSLKICDPRCTIGPPQLNKKNPRTLQDLADNDRLDSLHNLYIITSPKTSEGLWPLVLDMNTAKLNARTILTKRLHHRGLAGS